MRDTDKTKDSILVAAAMLFSRHGYEKTAIDEIAKSAHKAKASVYYYFDGKLEIFKTVVANEFACLRKELDGVLERYADDKKRCFGEYMMTRVKTMQQMPVYRSFLRGAIPDRLTGELSDTVQEVRREFDSREYEFFSWIGRECLDYGIFPETVKPDTFAQMLLTLLKGLEIQFSFSEDYDSMRAAYESLVELLVYKNESINPNNNCNK